MEAEPGREPAATAGHRGWPGRWCASWTARWSRCATRSTDEFAIAFGDVFYEHLLSRQQPVDVAVARALAEAAGPVPSAARPAVSLATPGVFGARAAGLTLPVPRGRPRLDPADAADGAFPRRARTVRGPGRGDGDGERRAGARQRRTAVLLHGMAGAGKTACALELAYRHQDAFAAAAFWQAPTRDDEWAGALADLANRLEIQLGDYGFAMAGAHRDGGRAARRSCRGCGG